MAGYFAVGHKPCWPPAVVQYCIGRVGAGPQTVV
jgi:hypothetical protein